MRGLYLMAVAIAAWGVGTGAQAQEDAPVKRVRKISAYEANMNARNEALNQKLVLNGKAKPGKIAACVKHAEKIAPEAVPEFVGELYDYLKGHKEAVMLNEAFNTFDADTKADQVDMLARQLQKRHAAIYKSAKSRDEFVREIMDPKYCMAGRKGRMEKADAHKDELIEKYSGSQKMSVNDENYLLAEGVIYDRASHTFQKTKDKFMDLKSCTVPNPANVDAFAWFIPYVKSCREDAGHAAHNRS